MGVDRLDDEDYPAVTMGQAAELLEVQPAFLRSLDAAGVLTPSCSSGGHRRYSRRQLAIAARIRELFDEGMTLDAAARIVGLQDELDTRPRPHRRARSTTRCATWARHPCKHDQHPEPAVATTRCLTRTSGALSSADPARVRAGRAHRAPGRRVNTAPRGSVTASTYAAGHARVRDGGRVSWSGGAVARVFISHSSSAPPTPRCVIRSGSVRDAARHHRTVGVAATMGCPQHCLYLRPLSHQHGAMRAGGQAMSSSGAVRASSAA